MKITEDRRIITFQSSDRTVEIIVFEIDMEVPSETTDIVIKRTDVQIFVRTPKSGTIIICK